MKKLLGLLLALSLFTAAFAAHARAAEDGAYILGGDVALSADADNIEIPVYVQDNSGLMGFGISLEYDKDVLEPLGVTRGSVIPNGMLNDSIGVSDNNSFRVIWTGTEEVSQDGRLFSVRFKVLRSDFVCSPVKISYNPSDTFDEQYNDVKLYCEESVVRGFLFGDVNRDLRVNINDATKIQIFLIGKTTKDDIDCVSADYNLDEEININDVTALQLHLAGYN